MPEICNASMGVKSSLVLLPLQSIVTCVGGHRSRLSVCIYLISDHNKNANLTVIIYRSIKLENEYNQY